MHKKLLISFFIVLSFWRLSSAKGLLEYKDLAITQSYDYYSSYIWRGFTLDTDPVFQPAFSVAGHDITASFWSNWNISNNDTLRSNEMDFALDYTYAFSYFNVSLGHIYYNFSGIRTYTSELYAGIQLEFLPYMPNIVYYYDYSTRNGSYVSIDTTKTYAVDKDDNIKFTLGAHAGFNNQLLLNGQGEDFSITGDLGLKLTENLGCSFVLGHSIPLGDLTNTNDGNQKSRFYAGIRLGAEF